MYFNIYIIYPTTSAHPASVLIPHPREIQIVMWSQTTVKQRVNQTVAIHQDKASEMLGVPGTRTQQNTPDHKKQRGTVGHFISAAMGLPRKRLELSYYHFVFASRKLLCFHFFIIAESTTTIKLFFALAILVVRSSKWPNAGRKNGITPPFFILFFNDHLLISSPTRKRFLPSATFWTSRGHRCLPFPPRYMPSFLWHIGCSIAFFELFVLFAFSSIDLLIAARIKAVYCDYGQSTIEPDILVIVSTRSCTLFLRLCLPACSTYTEPMLRTAFAIKTEHGL